MQEHNFDSFNLELIPKEITKFISKRTNEAKIYRI